MITKILHTLEALHIPVWAVEETVRESAEVFFIRKRLDLQRKTSTQDATVRLYRPMEKDGKAVLGTFSVPIHPGLTDEELYHTLEEAWSRTAVAWNPAYELYHGPKADLKHSTSGFAQQSLEENLRAAADTIFGADTREDAFLNTVEIFANRTVQRVLNSSGTDVSWETRGVQGEYVTQCLEPADVETYHAFRLRNPDWDTLRREVEEALTQTVDRASATVPPKAGTYNVILSGDQVREVLSYYQSRAASYMVYQKYSTWSEGDKVQGEDIQGDTLSITLTAADPYDSEGIPLQDRPLLENGVLRTIHGGARFAYYLGIQPTGSYSTMQVPCGTVPLAEMKRQPSLHVVSFSDFQMDDFTGHFGGEIRLAYLNDGETVRPVTGGSINGSILDAQKHLIFSQERYHSASYDGPLAVSIQGVAVAGAAE